MRALRISNVLVQKASWTLVLAAALVMPFAPNWLVLPSFAPLSLPPMPAPQAPAVPADAASIAIPQPGVSQPIAAPLPVASLSQPSSPSQPVAASHAATPLPLRLAVYAFVLYLSVAALLCLRLIFGLAAALRLWIAATPAILPASVAIDASVRSSARVASPVNIVSGIVLPANYASWSEEKLRIVLAHERSHIRQGDFYLQLLAGLYASLFWFSPLGWWLKHKLHELGEAISDRAGLQQAASSSSYAQLLLEFAALPRPTLTGVAMARTSRLAQRIERFLNESSFHQAFAASSRRAFAAFLLVPVALCASTALLRVQAATPSVQSELAVPPAPAPPSAPDITSPMPAPAPTPATAPVPPAAPSPDAQPTPAAPAPAAAPPAPSSPSGQTGEITITLPNNLALPEMTRLNSMLADLEKSHDLTARVNSAMAELAAKNIYIQPGDPYALIDSNGKELERGGAWQQGDSELQQARSSAHGAFLWFKRDGKAYIVDDPAVVAELMASVKPMDDLHSQMEAVHKQMSGLDDRQKALEQKMHELTVQTPDLSKEIAALKAATETLEAKQGHTITQSEMEDLQRQVGHITMALGGLQGKLGSQIGLLGGQMGSLGGRMGALGGQMGLLGAHMAQLSRESHAKIESTIDDSLKNGKARPIK
jgi:hypothetical protein